MTVGVLATQYNPTEGYETLINHIETKLTDKVESPIEVVLDVVLFDEPGAFKAAKEQLKNQHWDIAFTTAPLISATAVKNGYDFTARMFPQAPQFESALFVRLIALSKLWMISTQIIHWLCAKSAVLQDSICRYMTFMVRV